MGPVLRSGVTANAIIAAIRELNEGVSIVDRGSYIRVGVPERCLVTRSAIEANLGQPFRLPADLEPLMPAFAGHLTITSDEVRWSRTKGSI